VNCVAAAEMFFTQIRELCQIVQEEFVCRFDQFHAVPFSAAAATAFLEKLILCPTEDAARQCVRKDLVGALSFVLALQGIQQRIERDVFELPVQLPEHQTRFYLLACAVQEYLASLDTKRMSMQPAKS
jgi:hypothetical protein